VKLILEGTIFGGKEDTSESFNRLILMADHIGNRTIMEATISNKYNAMVLRVCLRRKEMFIRN
jgi:hypothetical protein